jgi:hypothetical protein
VHKPSPAVDKDDGSTITRWKPIYSIFGRVISQKKNSVYARIRCVNINVAVVFFFMSIGWGYVSELLPPPGLLFFFRVIYEYGEL